MNLNYQEVPNMISCKDLDYLSDMFQWNYGAYKSAYNGSQNANDPEIEEMLRKASDVFYESMQKILTIVNQGGSDESESN